MASWGMPADCRSPIVHRRARIVASPAAQREEVAFNIPDFVKCARSPTYDDDASTEACSTPAHTLTRTGSLISSDDDGNDSLGMRRTLTMESMASSWPRTRTPSPEMSFYVAGRSLPPPCLLLLPTDGPASAAATPVAACAATPRVRGFGMTTPSSCKSGVSWADLVDDSDEEGADEECLGGSPWCPQRSVDLVPPPPPASDEVGVEEPVACSPCSPQADSDEASELPLGLPSVGSEGHSAGECRPCAHIWRESGCSKGKDCTYCHLCSEADWRKYKRIYKYKDSWKGKRRALTTQ